MIEINYELCVGCGLCAMVCPTGAITMLFGKPTVNPWACAGCGYCLQVCPRRAIRWADEEVPRKVPGWPSISSDYWHEWDQFPSRRQALRRTPLEKSDLNDLKQWLDDLRKKVNEIVRRIGHL